MRIYKILSSSFLASGFCLSWLWWLQYKEIITSEREFEWWSGIPILIVSIIFDILDEQKK